MLYTTGNRVWISCAGLATAILIARLFTPELQGYYYTFTSLMLAQTMFDLGFNQVMVHFISHEKPLEDDQTAVNSRLKGLLRFGLRVNLLAAGGFLSLVGGLGVWLLAQRGGTRFAVYLPWSILVFSVALNLSLAWLRVLMEGTQRIADLQKVQLLSGIAGYGLGWLVMIWGGGLYGPAVISLTIALIQAVCLAYRNRHYLALIRDRTVPSETLFFREFWRQSWRMALSWISGYLAMQTFVPILFHFQGPVVAGQMGMSMQLYTGCSLFASIWLYTQAPRFGQLAAAGKVGEIRSLVRQVQERSLLTGVLLAGLLWSAAWVAENNFGFKRLLSVDDLAVLLTVAIFIQYMSPQATAVRFFKIEPFMMTSITSGFLITLSNLLTAKCGNVFFMCCGFLLVSGLMSAIWVQWIYHRFLAKIERRKMAGMLFN